MKTKGIIIFIISLICPVIGIILYIIFKKDNDKKKNALKGLILGLCIYSVALLYFATHSTDYFNRDVKKWQDDVKSGNTVVTVIGASYCEHCQAYKPVIQALANKNHINLYFYEIDTLSEEDQTTLTTTFELPTYEGKVPYTFIMKDGQFLNSDEGFQDQSTTVAFLMENGIIKN